MGVRGMKTILTALAAASTLFAATAASSSASLIDDFVATAIVGKGPDVRPAYVAMPQPGYIIYSGHSAPLPAASCYWTRMPLYDSDRSVLGWRGRPVAVCPQPRVTAEAE
jgi:hypothetical protein